MPDIKDYKYKMLSDRKLKKDDYVVSEELKDLPERQELNRKMQETLSAEGLVFFLTKDSKVNGVILLDHNEVDPSAYGIETDSGKDKAEEKESKIYAYETREIYLNDDLKNRQDLVMKDLLSEIKEFIYSYEKKEVKVIKCGDHMIAERSKRTKYTIATCMLLGICAGALVNFIPGLNSYMGISILLGMMAGMIIGLLVREKTDSWK
ncbi:MAG: hypothetical protein K6G42_07760 [Lachnospiraceae bacterium]|nr:hypothetical protein [Lachnospiraceae bacterium]